MKALLILIWLLPIAGVVIGMIVLVGGLSTASGAPQEAVIVALTCACAILPYCLARALSEIINALAAK